MNGKEVLFCHNDWLALHNPSYCMATYQTHNHEMGANWCASGQRQTLEKNDNKCIRYVVANTLF